MYFLTLLIVGMFSNLSIAQSPEPDHDSGAGVELILSPDGRTELIFRTPEEVKEKRRREDAAWEALPQSAKLQKCLGQYQQEFGLEDPDNAYFWGNENSLYSFSDKGIEKTKIPVEAWKKLENFKGRDKNAPAVWAELSVRIMTVPHPKETWRFSGKCLKKDLMNPSF